MKRKIEIVVAGDSKGGRQAFEETGEAGDKFASKVSKIGDKIRGKLGDSLGAGLGMLGLGAGAGAIFVEGLSGALEQGKEQAKLGAQLGIDPGMAKELGKTAGGIYAQAYGDSLGDVNSAIKSVVQNVGGLGTTSKTEFEDMTKNALNLASTFEVDVNDSTRAVGALLKNGLAVNATEAFDIITTGFQRGADKGGEFLDTLNEYAEPVKSLGLSAGDFTAMMIKAGDQGVYSVDKVGDALKEFSIRAVDGSKTSTDAFATIGLSAWDMSHKIAAGGPAAKEAMSEIVQHLGGVTDKVKQDEAGVALFGTMWEDIGADVILGLDPAKQKIDEFAGAAKTMNDGLGADNSTKIETWKRSMETGFTNFMAEKVIPAADSFGSWWTNNIGTFEDLQHGATMVGDGFAWIGDKIMWVKDHVLDPFVGSVQTIVAGLGEAWQQVQDEIIDPVFGFVQTAVDKIAGFFSFIKNSVFDPVIGFGQTVFGVFGDIIEFFENLPGNIGAAASSMWDTLSSTFKGVANQIINIWNGLDFGIHIGVPDWVPGIGGKSFDINDVIPDLPYFHTGTMRYKAPVAGGEGLAVLRDGESVGTPGSGGGDVYVYFEQTASGMVARLTDHQKAGGTVPWVRADR